ncbi:MAG: HAMP domain-containing histidine kinase [Leptospiraceae bacterium]|nr:HAMP domain-containing histidine kinase [Leptospiraceae bacterium]
MDFQTLNYAVAMLSFSAFLVSISIFPKIKGFPGSFQWFFAITQISVGTLLVGLREIVSDIFSIYLANILLIIAPATLIQSFKILLDIPSGKKVEYIIAGLFCPIFIYFALAGSTRDRILVFSLAHAVLWMWGGISILLMKSKIRKKTISIILILMSILAVIRFLDTWNISQNISLFQIKGFNSLYMLFMLGFTFAIFSSYLILLNQKLLNIVVRDKESLFLANQSKERLFSIIAHDLRGPLGTIVQGLEFLKLEDNVEEKNLLFDKILAQAQILYQFLEKILDWVKSQHHGVVYNKIELPVKDIILNEIENCRGMADVKQIKILSPEINQQLMIYGDRITCGATIRNLLNNAIKFTPNNGSIRIFIQEVPDFVQIIIEDSGTGMSDSQIDNYNKKHLLTSTYGTQGEKGHGLGLAICREYISGNNGAISFEKGENGGTKVTVLFPKSKK